MFQKSFLFIIFILFSALNIISVKKANSLGVKLTKPFLMPTLLIIYLYSTATPQLSIILALTFAFLGDIFLVGEGTLFTVGLLCFLMGHIFYIKALLKPVFFSHIPYEFYIFALLYIFYGVLIFKMLSPYLKSMKFHALIYLTVILTMSFSSLLRAHSMNNYQFWLPFLGSILFISSDTMIAFNKFKGKAKGSEVHIMLTYIMAQLLIVLGFI